MRKLYTAGLTVLAISTLTTVNSADTGWGAPSPAPKSVIAAAVTPADTGWGNPCRGPGHCGSYK
jgi:hypothetical protein